MRHHPLLALSLICLSICAGSSDVAWAQKVSDIIVAVKGPVAGSVKPTNGEIPKGTVLTVKEVRGDKFVVSYVNGNDVLRGSIARSDVIPFKDAINFFTDDIQRKPTAENYCIRGTIWRLKREYDLAIGDYTDGIRLDAHYQPNFRGRGEAWIAQRQLNKIRLSPTSTKQFA